MSKLLNCHAVSLPEI